jgi:hypothetical protein
VSRQFIKAAILQFTGTVGAGIFSLPYVIYYSNSYISSLFLVFFAFLVIIVNRFYLDVITRTPGDHQLPGYAHIYLNSKFKNLAVLNIFLLAIGALSAYIQLAGSFINTLIPQIPAPSASIFFVLLISVFFFIKNRIFATIENVLPFVVIFISLLFFFLSQSLHLSPPVSQPFSLIFIGPVFFSLASFTIVPEVEEVLRSARRPQAIKSASMVGTLLALFLYLIFSMSLILLSGPHLSTDSITGLRYSSPLLAQILSFIGILIVFTASLNFINVIKEIFFRDLSFRSSHSHLFAILVPIFCLFFSKTSFLQTISITGSITVFISVLIICLIRLKFSLPAKDKFLLYLIIIIFFIGLLAELFL